MIVEPIHFQNVKILWKGVEADGHGSSGQKISFPKDERTGPNPANIFKLKKKISEKLPSEFPMEVLENAYSRLEHPDEK
jgi:hypothetical protein